MQLDTGQAQLLFVAFVLLLLATMLAIGSRRRPHGLLLAGFLLLVATNFFGVARLTAPAIAWEQLAFVALAFDPLLLLLFVVHYPYPRRTRPVQLLLALIALAGVLTVFNVITRPLHTVETRPLNQGVEPEPSLVAVELIVAYAAAWFLTVRAALDAPTPLLRQRAAWLVAAVGVAVVPRLGYLPEDFRFSLGAYLFPSDDPAHFYTVAAHLVDGLLLLALSGTLLGLGWLQTRRAEPVAPELRAAFRFVGLAVALLGVAGPAFRIWLQFGGPLLGFNFAFSLRWILFAAILVYGVLSFEIVAFHRASQRMVPVLGALVGAAGAFLFTLAYSTEAGNPAAVGIPLAIALGLGAAVPAGFLARTAERRWRPASETSDSATRRFELYRAVLESAWARGRPSESARRSLDRDRRKFGLTPDEARALEHVVATRTGASPVPLVLGTEILPGVVLRRLLGEGAHGRAFLADRIGEDRAVVVKELAIDPQRGESARRRLLSELQSLERLDHPRIVRLLEVHARPGRFFLVLDHVDARPLADVLRRGRIPPVRSARILDEVLEALGAAHRAGIVHRDVKPANVLIGRDGHARLTDFGVALDVSDPAIPQGTVSGLDVLGAFEGTLRYAAPEQVVGGRVAPATDLYAAGLVLLECLTGRPAIDLRGCSVYEALDRVAHPTFDLDRVPAAWRSVLRKAVSREPGGRFRDAGEFRAALRNLASEHRAGRRRGRTA